MSSPSGVQCVWFGGSRSGLTQEARLPPGLSTRAASGQSFPQSNQCAACAAASVSSARLMGPTMVRTGDDHVDALVLEPAELLRAALHELESPGDVDLRARVERLSGLREHALRGVRADDVLEGCELERRLARATSEVKRGVPARAGVAPVVSEEEVVELLGVCRAR